MFFKIQILELDRHEKLINNIVENLQCYTVCAAFPKIQ